MKLVRRLRIVNIMRYLPVHKRRFYVTDRAELSKKLGSWLVHKQYKLMYKMKIWGSKKKEGLFFMKILIVDDIAVNTRIMVHLLSEYAECHIANSGYQALCKVAESLEQSGPFDLICMDIMMPGMNGIQSIEKIRELETKQKYKNLKPTKILMVTTIKEDASVIKSIKAGCDGYILKPVDKYALVDQLHKLGILSGEKKGTLLEGKSFI